LKSSEKIRSALLEAAQSKDAAAITAALESARKMGLQNDSAFIECQRAYSRLSEMEVLKKQLSAALSSKDEVVVDSLLTKARESHLDSTEVAEAMAWKRTRNVARQQ